jgi:thiamine pyrophosphate-dependent acetolactate synthase large subunit-like protein
MCSGSTHFWEQSRIQHVRTCREDGAGFAADAYARINGLGAVFVTYCLGGLNLTNPIAGSYAENSPVIAISTGIEEQRFGLQDALVRFAEQKNIPVAAAIHLRIGIPAAGNEFLELDVMSIE